MVEGQDFEPSMAIAVLEPFRKYVDAVPPNDPEWIGEKGKSRLFLYQPADFEFLE